jgi:hypothetical protein
MVQSAMAGYYSSAAEKRYAQLNITDESGKGKK